MKSKLITGVIKFRQDIKSMNTIRELVEYIPEAAIEKVAYWLLMIMAVSPLYPLIRSVFLKYHDSFYITSNQRVLGEYWCSLIQKVGMLGLILFIAVFAKFIFRCTSGKDSIRKAIRRHPVPFFLFLLLLWSILSCAFSSNVTLSLHGSSYRHEGLYTYFAYAGVFCCGYMIRSKKYLYRFMNLFVFTAVVISTLPLLNIESLNRTFSLHPQASIFQNINHHGYFLCLAIMAAVAIILKERRISHTIICCFLAYSVLIIALLTNKSFGPYIAVFAGLIFILVFVLLYHKKSVAVTIFLFAIFIAISFAFNTKNGYLKNETNQLGKDITNIVENNDNANSAGSGRWIIWKKSIQYILEKPLFGYGPENLYDRFLQDGMNHDRPHNAILQLSANLGIPSAIFYVAAMMYYFLPLIKNRKEINAEIIGLFSIITTYFVSSMVGLSMFYTTPFYFIFLGLTCLSGGRAALRRGETVQNVDRSV